MSREPVEYVRCHCVSSDQPCQADDYRDRDRVEQNDEEPVHEGFKTAFRRGLGLLHEEGDGHGDHGENAGSQEHGEAPKNRFDDQPPQAVGTIAGGGGIVLGPFGSAQGPV